MALINRFARRPMNPDEVFTFSLVLCDNEVDRDFERFDTAALQELACLFTGKTGLFNHSMDAKDQIARIYKARVITYSERLNSLGEAYACVSAAAYMPKTAKNADLMAEIDAGIKKEVSVGCAVGRLYCSVCGADRKKGNCSHTKGKTYDGKLCHTVLGEPLDAYEWSFVAVPAQREAGVVKKFKNKKEDYTLEDILKALETGEEELTLNRDEKQALTEKIKELEALAGEGRAYREELTAEAVRLGLIAMPQIGSDSLSAICSRLPLGELKELKQAFYQNAQKSVPLKPQLKPEPQKEPAANTDYQI